MILSYFTSADGPGPHATWTVYAELYDEADSEEPIDGTQRVVAPGLPGFDAAEQLSSALYATRPHCIIQEEPV